MRHTRSHTKNRRSHHALTAPALSNCSHCGKEHRAHHMCLSCGYYNGRQVMDLEAEKAKRDLRMKEKKERIKSELGTATPVGGETTEVVSTEDTHKEAKEENLEVKKPEKPRK